MTLSFPFEVEYDYRPLKDGLSGWDVYALQTALREVGHHILADGHFGAKTGDAVELWQEGKQLDVDRIAGNVTQRSLVLAVGEGIRRQYRLPIKQIMGSCEKETGFIVGEYTEQYTNGSRDMGVIQLNDLAKQVEPEQAFSVPFALDFFARTLRTNHDRYLVAPLRPNTKRVSNALAWQYAAGSWNRPAHTAYLAGMRGDDAVAPSSRTLTAAQREWIEGYIDRVCTYSMSYYAHREWPS